MSDTSFFPDWLGDCAVGDAFFAAAYDAVPAARRAWIKTTLARHAALCGGGRGEVLSTTRMGQGWRLSRQDAPCAWGVLCAPLRVSPVKLAAALMPMLQAGVPHLVVAFVGETPPLAEDLPVAALAALELAGQEQVATLAATQAVTLVRQMAEAVPEGCVAVLDASLALSVRGPQPGQLRVWQPGAPASFGVWGGDAQWDWEALVWAHPDAAITAWNAGKTRLPKGIASRKGDFAAFCGQGYGVLAVPDALADSALAHAPVVLGPGHEGCWIWPDLSPEFFRVRRVGFCG